MYKCYNKRSLTGENALKCKHCNSEKLQKRGKINQRFMGTTKSVDRYQCTNCGRYFQDVPRHSRSAKILLLDIETLPGEFYGFSPYIEYATPDKMIKNSSIVCWAAKWLFEKEIMGMSVSPQEAIERKEGSILEGIWKLIDEADIVVTQNGIRFDMKKLSTEFLIYGYPPPSNYMNVDTLKTAKEVFDFPYNRLDELGKTLGIGVKKEMIFRDWRMCIEGTKDGRQKYLDKMLWYCKNDVAPLLEDVYLKFLPWMKNHPNLGVFADHDGDVCPRCESQSLSWNSKIYATPQGAWESWRCNSCGAIGRGHGKDHKIKQVQVSSVIQK